MARLATFAENLIFVLRLPIMAAEAVGHRGAAKPCPLRMVGIIGMTIFRHVASRHDDGVAFDRLLVHDARMAGRTSFPFAPRGKRRHVLSMAHDQADILQRRRQVTRRDLGHAQDGLMAADANLGVHLCRKIVRVG